MLKARDIKKQVDDLVDTFNDIAKMLGKENATVIVNKGKVEKETNVRDLEVCFNFP